MNKTRNQVTARLAEMALGYIGDNPEENLPRLLKWVDMIDTQNAYTDERDFIRNILGHPQGNWYRFIVGLWDDVDPEVRKVLFMNLFVNSVLLGRANQKELAQSLGCNLPWAILMDPTSACNLHCTGCWAAEYGNASHMDYATLTSIINQGKALGTYMYIYSGGEPLVRKKDLVGLCEEYPDCQFLSFTNGTLIDEEFADEMLRVKNFIPVISIEGFEKETDIRRGKGTYQAVVRAMAILKKRRLPFGISCCYTAQNAEVIGSEEYIDSMIGLGAKFAWFFTYIPIGENAVPSLMASAAQRKYLYGQLRSMRKTKPLFTMDFLNDGEYVKGCIAGGRCYLHINANGDIEPCAFIHYSDSNIHEKTLLEACKSPLFMQYHDRQPFNKNHLRPCPLLDNPECLRAMVHASAAVSTDLGHRESVDVLAKRCESASRDWAPVAGRLWTQEKGNQ